MRTRLAVKLNKPDWIIAILVVALVAFGVLMVFDASVVQAYHELGNEWYFIKNQSQSAIIGLFVAIIAFFFPLKKLEKLSPLIMVTAIIFLVIVLIPGIGSKVQGARRWLDFGFIRFQPSEYAKLASILYLSTWFTKVRPARSFAVLLLAVIGLIMLEPDMGTALVIIGISSSMFFLSGISIKKMIKLGSLGVLALICLIAIAPYRLNRVKTFMDPNHDPLGISYHSRQVLISLGSGGLLGTGLGRSRQKFQYLPEATTDSIFAVVAEEFGFFGSVILIMSFGLLVERGLSNSRHIQDKYSANVAAGVSLWIGTQVLLNLMAMVALVPIAGVPLPLISYGGSALVTMLAGIGLLLNATRYREA